MQAAFSPSKADVEAAMRLVAAFKEHQDKGHGAFVFEGRLAKAGRQAELATGCPLSCMCSLISRSILNVAPVFG